MIQFGDTRLPKRFWNKCVPEPNSGCWLWIGALNRSREGYAHLRVNKVDTYGHRHAYETLVGPIDPALEIDHKCDVSCCVNPAHLEPKSHLANVRRSRATYRTRCRRGHDLTVPGAFYYYRARGGTKRDCRLCNLALQAKAAK